MNRAVKIYNKLINQYPDAKCRLEYESPFQILVSTILSAQTTDYNVNNVTKKLYKDYGDLNSFLNLKIEDLEKIIRPLGLYKNKSKHLYNMCRELVALYDGKVPNTMEKLIRLSGVGRKTASVVLIEAFNIPAMPVDTHVSRVAKRIGLSKGKTADKVSDELMIKYPEKYWIKVHHLFIKHGREICHSRNPECEDCIIKDLCYFYEDGE